MMGNTVETKEVRITKEITIQKYVGATSDKPTIDFNGKGNLNVSGNLALKNIKIANGKNTNGGGGIFVSVIGSLVAEGILISGCNDISTNVGGGGILAYGTVKLTDSDIENCNTACVSAGSTTYGGGAICYTGSNSLKLSNVTFRGNSAPASNGKDIYFANGSAEFEDLTGDNAADDNTVSIYWDYHAFSASMKLSGNINAMPLCLMDSSQKIDCAALGKGSGPIRVSNPNALTWTFTNGFTGTPVSDYFVGINCTIDTESAVSNEAAFVSDTTANSVYVSSSGSDDTGNGTKSKPYATFKKAALSFDNKTAITAGGIPENTVYFLDDMTITEGMGFTDKCAVNLIGCKSGTPNAPVKITSDLAAGSALQVQAGQNFVIKNINWTGNVNYGMLLVQDTSSAGTKLTITDCEFTGITGKGVSVIALEEGDLSLKNVKITENTTSKNDSDWVGGAVYVKGGTFTVNDGVIINSNTAAAGASANNLYLWGDDSTSPGLQTLITVGEKLTTTSIEFAMYHTATVSSSVTFTSGYTTSGNTEEPKKFFNEENGCGIVADSGEAVEQGRRYFYVRGTGGVYGTTYPAAAAASDTNNGTSMSPYATVQKAVNEVALLNDGDSTYEIIVGGEFDDTTGATGAFVSINANGKTLDIEIKGLSNDAGKTVFDSSSLTGKPCVKIESSDATCNASVVLNGISITGGDTSSNNGDGGGIQVKEYSNLMLEDCEIYGNKAENGGGIYAENASVVLQDCTVSGCSANSYGGGIYFSSNNSMYKLQFKGTNKISSNSVYSSYGYALGGGIYCSGNLELGSGVIIEKNYVTGKNPNGGGVYSTGELTISGATIGGADAGNTAEKYGGGIYADGKFTMTGGTVQGNSALLGGGGIVLNGESTLSGGAIISNRAVSASSESLGGGIYAQSAANTTIKGDVYILSNTAGGTDSADKSGYGGGILSAGKLVINGGFIADNKVLGGTAWGGGVCVMQKSGCSNTFTMSGGTIGGVTYNGVNYTGNRAENGLGGGIASLGMPVEITGGLIGSDTDFDNGNIAYNGGGICLGVASKLTGTGGKVSYNKATQEIGSTNKFYGGGLCFTEGYSVTDYALTYFENNNSYQVYNADTNTSLKD